MFLMRGGHWSRSPDTAAAQHQTLVQRAQTTLPGSWTTSQHPAINFSSAGGEQMPHHMHGAGKRPGVSCGLCTGLGDISWVKFSDDPGKQTAERSISCTGWSDLGGQSWRFVPGWEVLSNLPEISLDNCPLNAVWESWYNITSNWILPHWCVFPSCNTLALLRSGIFWCRAAPLSVFQPSLLIPLWMTKSHHTQAQLSCQRICICAQRADTRQCIFSSWKWWACASSATVYLLSPRRQTNQSII